MNQPAFGGSMDSLGFPQGLLHSFVQAKQLSRDRWSTNEVDLGREILWETIGWSYGKLFGIRYLHQYVL